MLTINEPIGRLVALAKIKKNILPQKSIEKDISNLIDLITVRISEKPIEDVANGLLENIYDLRFDLLEWLSNNDKDVNFYLKTINEHIAVNLQLKPYSTIADTISKVLMEYEKIVSPIFNTLSNSIDDIFGNVKNNKLEYNSLSFLSLHPSPQIKYLKKWIDASLQFEVGLIIADLILTKQIKLPKSRINSELIEFLYSTITRFGAFSIFTGFWIPDSKDNSNLSNRMKILSATLELENKSYYPITKDTFFNMLNN